jgi:hypothetical protein
LLFAWWFGWHADRPTLGWVLLLVAVGGGVAGLLWPAAIRPIFVGWMVLAFPIGWFISRLILGILFYALFTPIGMIFRLMGRDALRLRPPRGVETYWQPKEQATDPRSYLRQF